MTRSVARAVRVPGLVAAAISVAALLGVARSEVGPHALIAVSQELLRAYNGQDPQGLHGLLAPSLQAKYAVEDLRLMLAHCRALTHDIERFSIPSWGARRFGFFGVYAETTVFEMILEIDEAEKIVHWVITDDVMATDQQCAIRGS